MKELVERKENVSLRSKHVPQGFLERSLVDIAVEQPFAESERALVVMRRGH